MTVFMREAIGWVVIALLLGSLVFFLPWRARRTIVLQRRYPYAPGVVWDQLFADPPNLISHTSDPFDPAVKIVTFEAGFGAAKRPVVSRIRVLNEEKPVRSVTRIEELDGIVFPFGEDSTIAGELRPVAGGSLAILAFDGMLKSSLEAVSMRWRLSRQLKQAARTLAQSKVGGTQHG